MGQNENLNEETFEYTYSSKKQEEIERIKNKYISVQDDKMDMLRKLDQSVTVLGTIWSIVIGMIGTLIFGAGMSCSLVWKDRMLVPGIAAGLVGLLIMALAYPLYKKITKNQREKLAPQILALAEELSK